MSAKVILQARGGSKWLLFDDPVESISAYHLNEVQPQLEKLAAMIAQESLYGAGFICYEAAPAFDEALVTRDPGKLPLLWFGLFERPTEIIGPGRYQGYKLGKWVPGISKTAYREACEYIKEMIAQGQTYQVNFTFRQHADFQGDPRTLFAALMDAQQAKYGAFIDLGRHVICSASPELFFSRQGSKLISKPMKGTVGRGCTLADDNKQAQWLFNSPKNRAENVMIVDMIRNDLGRISEIGSVEVSQLFHLERYPTIWQMTSTVESYSNASMPQIMASLFPCASITGAPKVSTMKIIADLENSPRGVYSGCIGYISPNLEAQFSVAIRTITIDKEIGAAEYGVGGGIVWDSQVEEEYRECLTKSLIIKKRWPEFRLLETILWTPDENYFLLGMHLDRIADSASYFGFPLDRPGLERYLEEIRNTFSAQPQRVRLLLDSRGKIETDVTGISYPREDQTVKIRLAKEPVNSQDVFLYHKTTNRRVYDIALADRQDCDEVLLWNERGEITEAATANIVLRQGGSLITPAVESGLLPGTFRQHLIDKELIFEETVMVEDLGQFEEMFLINSVRKWRRAELILAEQVLSHVVSPLRSQPL